MNLRSKREHENIRYSSLWKREVRRDFYGEDIITKSPLSPLFQRRVFSGRLMTDYSVFGGYIRHD
jgi:hypothetical protein